MYEDQALRLSLGAHRTAARGVVEPPVSGLRSLLLGERASLLELPALPDLVAAVSALARGARRKVIVPLPTTPAELALVRRDTQIAVDCYSTESAPDIYLRERLVSLEALLQACAAACTEAGVAQREPAAAAALARLSLRLHETSVQPDPHAALAPAHCTGGCLESPGPEVAMSFGFSADILPRVDSAPESLAVADVHALLFEGRLWTFCQGRRFELYQGPIMLAAQRMVAAMRALCEAWHADRAVHVRLLSGRFAITVRRDKAGKVALSLSGGPGQRITWPELDVPAAALPILRLASDLIRKLIATDRRQSHNLRITALRAELRALRRMIRARNRLDGFENSDPERLRLSSPAQILPTGSGTAEATERSAMRYTERWRVEVDGLDAGAFYLCGDRVVVASQKLTLAIARGSGELLWSHPTAGAAVWLAGQTLLRVMPDGELELCDLGDGSAYATSQITPRSRGVLQGLFAGGGDLPPVAILAEARRRLVAVDLRTGEPRWRFRVRGHGTPQLSRSGRVLVIAGGDGALDALDVSSGEAVWRYSDRARFCLRPALSGELLAAVSGEPGGGRGAVYGIELFSGRKRWQRELPAAPTSEPLLAGNRVVVACGRSRQAALCGFDADSGEPAFCIPDPGLDNGARAMSLDRFLIVNTPSGRVLSLCLEDGSTRWSRTLANPLTDDVPRQLDPSLRHGALFVPSAQVHILRPSDGVALSEVQCDLVPDCLRVDELGWFYVAEESGHVRAFAAAPRLSLVR